MTSALRSVLTTVPLVLFGLMAGFFYAFSVSVMPGLDRIDAASAIKAMQGINLAVRNTVFFITYCVTPIIALLVGALLWVQGVAAAARWLIAAGLLYAAGVLLPTGAINVPMNDALAAISEAQATASEASIWAEYSSRWSLWNAVRAACATLALGFTAIALHRCRPAATLVTATPRALT